ncbi:Secreted protein [Xanthomonas citri pv. citri]|nr:Secreted protein [Xanthomonas citri pv. citri]CEH60793.1 Secreted protein [Xanthomonas citri pv. citri]CEI00178.1 Secreted protein [Xanthomonas citri pv. citri]
MKTLVAALGAVVLATASLVPATAAPHASAAAEKQLWAFSEKIALALPGNGKDVLTLVSPYPDSVALTNGQEPRKTSKQIAPSLFASNAVVVMGADNRADSASFEVTGSCVSMAALRKQYARLIVMDYARGVNEHAVYTLGAQIGDAIVAYSFPASKLDCMSRVFITPAKITKNKLGIA